MASGTVLQRGTKAALPIGEDVAGLGRLVEQPRRVDDDLDQRQQARDGQLRRRTGVARPRTGAGRAARLLAEDASDPAKKTSFSEFYWVLPSFTEFYPVLLGFTYFNWVLLGFT